MFNVYIDGFWSRGHLHLSDAIAEVEAAMRGGHSAGLVSVRERSRSGNYTDFVVYSTSWNRG